MTGEVVGVGLQHGRAVVHHVHSRNVSLHAASVPCDLSFSVSQVTECDVQPYVRPPRARAAPGRGPRLSFRKSWKIIIGIPMTGHMGPERPAGLLHVSMHALTGLSQLRCVYKQPQAVKAAFER